ncbi:unnamed protein product [Brachionus calyciflorus]|uniref:Uncharacterized protein n=1 Tax=Brachionus calyciflorus TaxID=104777 RepID=A0A814JRQ1_9BILA|nr:unnamed protein product [Brachionus calyciflorus]
MDLSKLSNCDITEHGDGYSCINLMERFFNYCFTHNHKNLLSDHKNLAKIVFGWENFVRDQKYNYINNRIKYISTCRIDINIHRIFLSKSELPELARNYLDIDVKIFQDYLQIALVKSINLEDMEDKQRTLNKNIRENCTNEKEQRSYFENLFYLSALEMFKLYNRSIVNEYLNNIANKIINEKNLTDLYFNNSSQNLFNNQKNRSITTEELSTGVENNKQLQKNCDKLQNYLKIVKSKYNSQITYLFRVLVLAGKINQIANRILWKENTYEEFLSKIEHIEDLQKYDCFSNMDWNFIQSHFRIDPEVDLKILVNL